MCELFAMSARLPADTHLSLSELARHGGATGPHRDGWGAAFYEGPDVHRFREAAPASESALVRLLGELDCRSRISLLHIRKATQGIVALRNTQPFIRELGGRAHSFAHNGMLRDLSAHLPLGRFLPLGETDSEHAFCSLMEAMRALWRADEAPPSLADRRALFSRFCATLRPLGPANIVYSDGDALFVHAHERTQPSGEIGPPGLYSLTRRCQVRAPEGPDAQATEQPGASQEVTLFASLPLSDEPWTPLAHGQVLVAQAGRIVAE